jgi:hypothetical protein
MIENDTPMGDSVNDVDLKQRNPDLHNTEDKPAASKLDDLSPEDLAAIAGEEDEDQDRDDKGRFVPRARLDEQTAQRNAERDRAAAAEAKVAELEAAAAKAAEDARIAAEKASARDFEAERDALEKKYYEDNEIDALTYTREMRKLDKDERDQLRKSLVDEALAKVDERTKAQRERDAEANARAVADDAEAAAKRFIEDPANAAYKDDKIRLAALNQARELIYAEKDGKIGWDELNAAAKARVEEYLTGKKAPEETEQQRVARERRAAQARTVANVSTLPERPDGGQGTRGTDTGKDDEEMTREEWAKLSKAERDKRLGRTAA